VVVGRHLRSHRRVRHRPAAGFIGDAISHAVFPGIVLAYLAGLSIFGGALVAGLITAFGIALVARGGRIREDAAIGIFFAAAFALGIVLISTRQTFQGDLTGFLIGNLQGVSAGDIAISAAVGVGIIVVLAAVHKELVLVSFDRTLASALGYPVFALDALLLVLLTVTIVVSIQAVGSSSSGDAGHPGDHRASVVDRFVPMLAPAPSLAPWWGRRLHLSFHLGTASGGRSCCWRPPSSCSPSWPAPHGLLGRRLHRHPQHAGASPAVDPPTGHQHS
jgi:manganese/iron transport system permease protein